MVRTMRNELDVLRGVSYRLFARNGTKYRCFIFTTAKVCCKATVAWFRCFCNTTTTNRSVISKTLTVTAFFEAYDTYVNEFIGQANCSLKWIFRDSVAVAAAVPALDTDQPYSIEHGSVAEEMVNRLSHTHPHYRVDNATGYAQLVTATPGTQYAATIAPFKRTRNGRGALTALKAQFAGPAF